MGCPSCPEAIRGSSLAGGDFRLPKEEGFTSSHRIACGSSIHWTGTCPLRCRNRGAPTALASLGGPPVLGPSDRAACRAFAAGDRRERNSVAAPQAPNTHAMKFGPMTEATGRNDRHFGRPVPCRRRTRVRSDAACGPNDDRQVLHNQQLMIGRLLRAADRSDARCLTRSPSAPFAAPRVKRYHGANRVRR